MSILIFLMIDLVKIFRDSAKHNIEFKKYDGRLEYKEENKTFILNSVKNKLKKILTILTARFCFITNNKRKKKTSHVSINKRTRSENKNN